ncbi:MAG: hypothetical protein KIG14_03075 [Candidatus Sacchiramonaceae bacterium]|nr:hypothetical protein [Candidatus Saccharimonadaceae bacterium]
MLNYTNVFWAVLVLFATSVIFAAFLSKGKVARAAISLIGIAVMTLPIITSLLLVDSPKSTVAQFNPETVAMMVEPTPLAEKAEDEGEEEPVLAGAHNDVIPPVLDDRTELTGYAKLLHALDLPGAGLPGYITANGFHKINGYKSYNDFYKAVKIMAEIEEKNPNVNFNSMVAYGRSTDENVDVQEMVDSALSAGLHIEDALGFVAKPQGEVLIGSGSIVGGDANGAGTVVAYPTEVGRSSNIVINIFPPEMVEKIAKQYGVGDDSKLAAIGNTIVDTLGTQTVYASESNNDGYIQQTFKIKQVDENTTEITLVDENGKETPYSTVHVPANEASRFVKETIVEKHINASKNVEGKTVYEPCLNPNLGMTTKKTWKKTPQPPTVVVPPKTPETPKPEPTPEPEPEPEEPLAPKEEETLESGMPSDVEVEDPVESSMSETSETAPITSDNSTEMSDELAEGAESTDHSKDVEEAASDSSSKEPNEGMGENPFSSPDSTEESVESVEEVQEESTPQEQPQEEQPAAAETVVEESTDYAPTPSIGDDAVYVEELPAQEPAAPVVEQPVEPAEEAPAVAETPAVVEPAETAPVVTETPAVVEVEYPEETIQDTVTSGVANAAFVLSGTIINVANAAVGFAFRKSL